MELINSTRMPAGFTVGMDPDGRESLVVVIKGTFRIPAESGAAVTLDDTQVPLLLSDTFWSDPGASAPKQEADFAPVKGRCDVLLNGTAYAPNNEPARRVLAEIRIGPWSKSIVVVGDRSWYFAGGPRASDPLPFLTMPISYDRAFGGIDERHEDPGEQGVCMANPSGRGYHKHLVAEWLQDSPLPNLEEVGRPVTLPDGDYRPMAYGPLGRHWEPRCKYAGTYDQNWLDNIHPFLPPDFDAQYYQAAPLDQQLELPAGELRVTLSNLTPDGLRTFTIPAFEAPVHVFAKRGGEETYAATLDTLDFEPDLQRLTLTWRLARPLARSVFEVAQVLVGRGSPAWWRARRFGKAFYPSITEMMKKHVPE
jgi:hypothetical protein